VRHLMLAAAHVHSALLQGATDGWACRTMQLPERSQTYGECSDSGCCAPASSSPARSSVGSVLSAPESITLGAGPTTVAPAGTSCVTTTPAPIRAPRPI